MSLTYEVDSLDAVPEAVRSFYGPTDDGKFAVVLDGAAGLTSALKKERADRKALEKELRPLGETLEQRAERIASITTFETTVEQIKTLAEQEKAAMVAELDSMRSHERDTIAQTVLAAALSDARITDEGVELITGRLIDRVRVETVDGKRKVRILQADGQPMLNTDGKPAGFKDLASEARDAFPKLFRGSGAGGGGTPPKQQTVTSKTITRANWESLSPQMKADRMRNGYKLVD